MRKSRAGRAPPALPLRHMANSEEIQRPVKIAVPQREVRSGDRRREAIVKRLGHSQPLVHMVPAKLDCDLMGAQLAGVKEAEQLDSREVRLAEGAELLGAILA